MSDYYLGEIRMFGFNYPPRGWAKCDGQYLQISQYQAVFALIATFYGGNGTNNFRLPDLQGRMPMSWGSSQSGGLQNVQIGQSGGQALTSIPAASLPTHTHNASFSSSGGGSSVAIQISTGDGTTNKPSSTNNILAANSNRSSGSINMWTNTATSPVNLGGVSGGGSGGGTVTVDPAGSGQAFETVSPYLALNFSIALMDGLFPARN